MLITGQTSNTSTDLEILMNISENIQPQSLRGKRFIKATVLLTIAVFLISAPAPDPAAIADMTSNLIVIAKNPVLGL